MNIPNGTETWTAWNTKGSEIKATGIELSKGVLQYIN